MIRNSLFGSVETWPWQVLSTGGKVGRQGVEDLKEDSARPSPPWPGLKLVPRGHGWDCDRSCIPAGAALYCPALALGRRGKSSLAQPDH